MENDVYFQNGHLILFLDVSETKPNHTQILFVFLNRKQAKQLSYYILKTIHVGGGEGNTGCMLV